MKLTWFGHSTFRVEVPGAVILIDPFFTHNPAFTGDRAKAVEGTTYIAVTHGHADHVGDALELSNALGAPVVSNYDLLMHLVAQGLQQYTPMNTGGSLNAGPFWISLVRADHSAGLVEQGVGFPLGSANGVIISASGQPTLWHMGDTDIFSDMELISEIHAVDVCLCPIGDRFTMGARTAAMAMKRFARPKIAIPCHYGSFPIIDQAADRFVGEMVGAPTRVIVPRVGETLDL